MFLGVINELSSFDSTIRNSKYHLQALRMYVKGLNAMVVQKKKKKESGGFEIEDLYKSISKMICSITCEFSPLYKTNPLQN